MNFLIIFLPILIFILVGCVYAGINKKSIEHRTHLLPFVIYAWPFLLAIDIGIWIGSKFIEKK